MLRNAILTKKTATFRIVHALKYIQKYRQLIVFVDNAKQNNEKLIFFFETDISVYCR